MDMLLIRAIIRPERVGVVLSELADAGFPSVTKMDVVGRGKQAGIKVGEITYDELPKEMLLIVVKEEEKEDVVHLIMKNAKSSHEGSFGDGKIFISEVLESYTIRSGEVEK
jgi:nitrogen regulatory protein PII 1